ncbi:L,D-transpeptidase [Wenjunlia tyrosinilytica]|uniref:Lipoprotein n=1 Tax=Wenjunlia tyrosinilytica TaxID=1544741 RepID=A0A917ZLP5_9ACTN|nr:Ig-like domain-containing protein [Wenjunlia tyrosinilytica]GGO86600.1 lipoprotein [Wenjunlia tyrosinilytica]
MIFKDSGRGARVLAASFVGVALLAGCSSGSGSGDGKAKSVNAGKGTAAQVTVTPGGAKSKDVDPGQTVKVAVEHGSLTSVEVAPAKGEGAEVTGAWGKGRQSWHSNRTMTPGTTYVVNVVATNAAGDRTKARKTFTTRTPQLFNSVNVVPSNGAVVGVGQPVSIAFEQPVKDRAAVERSLSVTTSPKVEGSWGWVRDPLTGVERVDWRPKEYWAKGTKVTMRAHLSGVNTGGGRYLRRDVTTTFTIGTARVSKVDLKKHTLEIFEDGTKIRTIPVSGGQDRYPTWNGTMVVLDKASMVHMTSQSVNITDTYDKNVPWAVHLTTSGTYAHAAPWNEPLGYFGRVNMSHGCVGMSGANGKWFFERAVRGDVVEVTGSIRATVSTGNGFGDWNPTFEEWSALSALK